MKEILIGISIGVGLVLGVYSFVQIETDKVIDEISGIQTLTNTELAGYCKGLAMIKFVKDGNVIKGNSYSQCLNKYSL